jgi:hypothetical protein
MTRSRPPGYAPTFRADRPPQRRLRRKSLGVRPVVLRNLFENALVSAKPVPSSTRAAHARGRLRALLDGVELPRLVRGGFGSARVCRQILYGSRKLGFGRNNLPVFFSHDAIKFPDFVHANKPPPVTNVQDPAGAADEEFFDLLTAVSLLERNLNPRPIASIFRACAPSGMVERESRLKRACSFGTSSPCTSRRSVRGRWAIH